MMEMMTMKPMLHLSEKDASHLKGKKVGDKVDFHVYGRIVSSDIHGDKEIFHSIEITKTQDMTKEKRV